MLLLCHLANPLNYPRGLCMTPLVGIIDHMTELNEGEQQTQF